MTYENYEEVQEQEQEIQENQTVLSKVVKTPEDVIYYTDTDDRGYPIYITALNTVKLKKRPDAVIKGVVYVKSVEEAKEDITHPLFDVAVEAIKDITGGPPRWIYRNKIVYEIYRGEMEELLGEATGYAIRIVTPSKFSGDKYAAKKAFAAAYDAKRRIVAKYKEFENRVYITGEYGRRGRAYVNIVIKLPIVTEEFSRLVSQLIEKKEEVEEEETVRKEEKEEVVEVEKEEKKEVADLEEIERRIRRLEEELLVLKSKLELLKSKGAAT
ncbi:MAG: hypothetical protein QW251_03575 [Desulfurococcaceae archaeon]